jgi:hypothetical protein
VEAPADWASLGSPETYASYERTENFASPIDVLPGRRHAYTAPAEGTMTTMTDSAVRPALTAFLARHRKASDWS